jgi:hypothetical protein
MEPGYSAEEIVIDLSFDRKTIRRIKQNGTIQPAPGSNQLGQRGF